MPMVQVMRVADILIGIKIRSAIVDGSIGKAEIRGVPYPIANIVIFKIGTKHTFQKIKANAGF